MGWLAATAVVLVLFVLLPWTCAQLPSPDNGRRSLEKQGWTQVEFVGRSPWANVQGCGRDDTAIMWFTGVNPSGRRASVEFCQGWPLKGATLRE